MKKKNATKIEERSKATKPANKNTNSDTPKTSPESSKFLTTTHKQTKRTVKNQSDSDNTHVKRGNAREEGSWKSLSDRIKYGMLENKYTKYITSNKGKAVLFVKKHIKKANNSVCIDIVEIDAPKFYEIGYLQFKTVICELFPRTIKPEYPPKHQYPDRRKYEMICKAIDWETAQKDIRAQRRKGIEGARYRMEGVIILNKNDRPPMFIKSAPDSVKALANDMKDKSNPAWEIAYQYLNPEFMDYDEYQYKIKRIEQLNQ